MQGNPSTAGWINRDLYPWEAKAHQVPVGTMRYVDESRGEPIVMVHGNPVWSFVYRKLIAGLSDRYRCIAPDHIGFGQSDKPYAWTYLPQHHAANLEYLLLDLDLRDITLVVQGWGGPIGLSYAVEHPERVKRLVILNTWMWPVNDDWYYQAFSNIVGGPLGRFLCRRINMFVRMVVPTAYGTRSRLTPEIHRHYFDPLPTGDSRKGTWVFPRQITHSSEWLASLWARRDCIAGKPAMFAWGMKDIAFREKELTRWQSLFPAAQVTRFPDAGHYVQDEQGEAIVGLMRDFMERHP
ncbi:MAG: alpha/beta fold hydrolase [Chloroflexi bacterium]|nr:alpha/beta fold hydrolase [Chloroflexota bacterium]